MTKIDETRPFKPVHIAVMTVSDSRTLADDKSGQALVDLIARDGHALKARTIVKDEQPAIVAQLKAWIADPEVDVVISTGGTGVTGRDGMVSMKYNGSASTCRLALFHFWRLPGPAL